MSIYYTYISNTKHYITLPYYFKNSFSRKFDYSNVELGHKVNLHLSFSGCLTEVSIRNSTTIPTNTLSDCFKFCDGQTIGIKVSYTHINPHPHTDIYIIGFFKIS